MTLFRVGSIIVDDRRELCLIKNISAGGMMMRVYCPLVEGTRIAIELKNGHPVTGRISWARDLNVGVAFDEPIDVIDLLSSSMDGPRPRMPRIEVSHYATLREGATVRRVKICDISQGGAKVDCYGPIQANSEIVLSLNGFDPLPGVVRWVDDRHAGLTFNRVLPLGELVGWLQSQRTGMRQAS